MAIPMEITTANQAGPSVLSVRLVMNSVLEQETKMAECLGKISFRETIPLVGVSGARP